LAQNERGLPDYPAEKGKAEVETAPIEAEAEPAK